MESLPTSRTLFYASACSGIDTVAAGMHALSPHGWRYAFASERDTDSAKVLADAWASHGLTPDTVFKDAMSLAATLHAPRVDIWVITPPCRAYSRRNHSRNAGSQLDAESELDAMLAYARVHSPGAIIVENVDEPEARSGINAALLSVPGYKWVTFRSRASEYGPMARDRRLWVGTLK
jgi:site-specific DNA-cytosine methylase